jgi:hypothetical protein
VANDDDAAEWLVAATGILTLTMCRSSDDGLKLARDIRVQCIEGESLVNRVGNDPLKRVHARHDIPKHGLWKLAK